MSLFGTVPPVGSAQAAPLAERMRPRSLAEFSGQAHLIGPGKPLRLQIDADDGGSMIFWGPPGTGKTTLAKIIAASTSATFIEFSAVLSGIKEIKSVMADAEKAAAYGSRTILFIDEIHRFNRAQQDAFLPYVERGAIRLIGATTENPSFEINAALLSRCRVYTLLPLSEDEIVALLERALTDPERGLGALGSETARGLGALSAEAGREQSTLGLSAEAGREQSTLGLSADREALERIADYTGGDARNALNALEAAAQLAANADRRITANLVSTALGRRTLLYDKSGEEHYNLISALHKSVRNSDADAALYWLARMLASGEDASYIARRVVRMAVEDIGLAAPEALNLCLSARDAMDFLGSPEGELALAEAVVYLALAPKSNSVYTAWAAVRGDVETTRAEPVPLHLRNAPTKLMRELSYGAGYKYAHDEEGRVAGMECLPESLRGRRYYHPMQEGREKLIAQRMEEIRCLRDAKA